MLLHLYIRLDYLKYLQEKTPLNKTLKLNGLRKV